ncbi:MAG: DNA polymerase I [Armatimonadota bacterium]|jgi:DNA polymerase-1
MADKVLLVDGHSLFHRAFHALPPLSTSDGQPTGALLGFLQMMMQLLEQEQPQFAAVALDLPGPTFRDQIYDEYKSHRPPTDDALRAQVPLLSELIEALGISAVSLEGYEADDVIGTLARRAAGQGRQVVIVTGDRDLLQLIDDNIEVVATLRGIKDTKRYDREAVREDYHLEPGQLIDLKALSGDSSDNIPGVAGIGDSSAQQLLEQFGSLEAALAGIDQIESTRIRNRLKAGPEQAELSRRLATIATDAPVATELAEIAWEGLPIERLRELAQRLEFSAVLDRLPQGEQHEREVHVGVVHEQERLDEIVAQLREEGFIALALADDDAPMLALAAGDDLAALIPLDSGAEAEGTLFATEAADGLDLSGLAGLLADETVGKGAADLKAHLRALTPLDLLVAGGRFDPEIASYLLLPNRRDHSIGLLAQEHLGYALPEADGESQAEIEPAHLRAATEALSVRDLREPMRGHLQQAGLLTLFDEIEMPLAPILAEMELAGIAVDTEKLAELGERFDEIVDDLEGRICELANCEFNVGSPQQLSEVLFERMELPKGRKTKTGWSTSAAVLEELAEDHEIAKLVLEYREYAKLRSTYVDGLLREVEADGRIHTTFEQTVAATGRLSSRNPNLQNIPIRTEVGRKIRSCFVSSPGHLLIAADYSQIELRILAHLSGDDRLNEAFASGADIHTETAAALFDVPADEVDYEMRGRAKTVNYAVLYGQGPTALGAQLGIPREEAEAFIENYFRALPGVRRYIDETVAMAREAGYVETLLGRKRPLPEINGSDGRAAAYAERAAVNTPIQGTAADIIKVAMIDLAPRLPHISPAGRMLLQVHDELVFEALEEDAHAVVDLAREVMEAAWDLSVPLTVDVSAGKNWRDMTDA